MSFFFLLTSGDDALRNRMAVTGSLKWRESPSRSPSPSLEEMPAFLGHHTPLRTIASAAPREAESSGIVFLSSSHRSRIPNWWWRELLGSGL